MQDFLQRDLLIEGMETQKKDKRSFAEFLVHFIVAKSDNTLTIDAIDEAFNQNLRYTVKKRCLVQTMISNRHLHLLDHILKPGNC